MVYGTVMTDKGKYTRTPEIREASRQRMLGRKQPLEAIAKRTATRRANGNYGTHGMYGTPTYHSWSNMIQRCTNPNTPKYEYYGGRGIEVCGQWREFAQFYADMGERPDGMTLDRIDSDGDYEPGNCRWATKTQQLANRKRSWYYDRGSRTNKCGHPERPHKARGKCGSCYFRWRTQEREQLP